MQAAAELLYIFGAEMLGDDNCGSGRQPGKKADYKVRSEEHTSELQSQR